ncbi:MAG: ABC transporter permease [Rubrobacter sp.]
MFAYIIRRRLLSFVVLFFASIAIFLLVTLAGDPLTDLRQNPRVQPEDIERIANLYGLNQPLWSQYFIWVMDLFRGDFGTSFKQNAPVAEIIARRVYPTVLLMGTSLFVTLAIAIPLGVYQAIKKYSTLDNTATILAFIGFSTPTFLMGILLQLVFGVYLTNTTGTRIFYTSGMTETGGFVDLVQHMALPVFALSAISIASFSRFQRSAMLDVMSSDYLRTARAKGLSNNTVYFKHALRNALIPTVTLVALSLGTLLAGAVITETVFAWPGLGFLFIDSLYKGDYNIARGILIIIAVLTVFFNLVADIVYAVVDPRVSYD